MAHAMNAVPASRIESDLKEALRTTANRVCRSIANMVEAMIRDYCGRNGVTIPEQQALHLEVRAKIAVTRTKRSQMALNISELYSSHRKSCDELRPGMDASTRYQSNGID